MHKSNCQRFQTDLNEEVTFNCQESNYLFKISVHLSGFFEPSMISYSIHIYSFLAIEAQNLQNQIFYLR